MHYFLYLRGLQGVQVRDTDAVSDLQGLSGDQGGGILCWMKRGLDACAGLGGHAQGIRVRETCNICIVFFLRPPPGLDGSCSLLNFLEKRAGRKVSLILISLLFLLQRRQRGEEGGCGRKRKRVV